MDSPNQGSSFDSHFSLSSNFEGMPAPRRHQNARHNRYNANDDRVLTDRYGNQVRPTTPRRDGPQDSHEQRMTEVSRNLIRLLRHLPKRHEAPFPLELPTGASIALSDIVLHPTFIKLNATESQVEEIVSRDDPRNKLRFDSYVTDSGQHRVRAFNGHSIANVVQPDRNHVAPVSRYIIHGTSLASAHAIGLGGFQLLGDRKDHHFIDSTYSARQFAYVKSDKRNDVWIMVDVHRAEALGCCFTKLPNEVIVTKGVDGVIPASAINSYWNSRRQCLESDAILASPPQAIVIPTPKNVHAPSHTDDDPAAEHIVPLASEEEIHSPSRNSPPPANQTKLDARSLSMTATSKSSPLRLPCWGHRRHQDQRRKTSPGHYLRRRIRVT